MPLGAGLFAGVITILAFGTPVYLRYRERQEFMSREVVTLQGGVIGERYAPAINSGCVGRGPSYYFSMGDPSNGRVTIQVEDNEGRTKESIDSWVNEGVRVTVKARQIADREYKAFADEIQWGVFLGNKFTLRIYQSVF